MAKQANYNKLSQMRAEERARAAQSNPGLLHGLTPTQLAELFPDYFKRGTPDVGGFRDAVSRASAERTSLWQKGVNDRLRSEGSWLEKLRSRVSGGGGGSDVYSGSAANVGASGKAVGQEVGRRLMRDYGLTKEQAAGILAHLGHESAGFKTAMQEQNPINGGRGGYGLAQWTGPRRRNLEAYAASHGGNINDLNTQYSFMTQESEFKRYIGAVKNAKTMEEAAQAFAPYESGGDPRWVAAWGRRYSYGKTALGWLGDEKGGTGTGNTNNKKMDGTTPQQDTGATTPSTKGGAAGGSTDQKGTSFAGSSYQVSSGFILPKDKKLYDARNAQQCATLGKAFNPAIGRSGTWTVVDGSIKPGQVVATKQYNNGGNDREGAGYHTGVALTAPNNEGKFLLLEQFNGQPARTKWVSKDGYPIGKTGKTTSFGLISSGGKVHDEISQEALEYGKNLAAPGEKQIIGTSGGTPGTSGEVAAGESYEDLAPVPKTPEEQLADAISQQGQINGEAQSATVMPQGVTPNLMGAMGGDPMGMMQMMGGFGGQSATPLGLITTAMGFIMPLIGSFGAGKGEGEGIGAGRRRRRRGRYHGHRPAQGGTTRTRTARTSRAPSTASRSTTPSVGPEPVSKDTTPIIHRPSVGEVSAPYESGKRGVATVSTGRQDKGGVSYGAHQLASKTGTMGAYIRSPEARDYAKRFEGMKPGSKEFSDAYRRLAKEDPTGFAKSQQDFITRTHYEPMYRQAKAMGYNMDDPRVQEALYSMSVQTGQKGVRTMLRNASSSIGSSPDEQVKALYASRLAYVKQTGQTPKVMASITNRYRSEQRDVLAMDTPKYMEEQRLAEANAPKTTQVASAQTTGTVGAPVPNLGNTQHPLLQTPQQPSTVSTPQERTMMARLRDTFLSSPAGTASVVHPAVSTDTSAIGRPTLNHPMMPGTNAPTHFPMTTSPVATAPVRGALAAAPGPAPAPPTFNVSVPQNDSVAFRHQDQQKPAQISPVVQSVNHDHVMKEIAKPADNPAMARAFARINMNEDPSGSLGFRSKMGQ